MAVADRLHPLVAGLLGDPSPIEIRFWDGSRSAGDGTIGEAVLHVRSPRALRRLLWAPNELGVGRGYVAGELEVTGDLTAMLGLRDVLERPGRDPSVSLGLAG